MRNGGGPDSGTPTDQEVVAQPSNMSSSLLMVGKLKGNIDKFLTSNGHETSLIQHAVKIVPYWICGKLLVVQH